MASYWYLQAAERGNAEAQYRLALLYETTGVYTPESETPKTDIAVAQKWYNCAARQCYFPARMRLKLAEAPDWRRDLRHIIMEIFDSVKIVVGEGPYSEARLPQRQSELTFSAGEQVFLFHEWSNGKIFLFKKSGYFAVTSSGISNRSGSERSFTSWEQLLKNQLVLSDNLPCSLRGQNTPIFTTTETAVIGQMNEFLKRLQEKLRRYIGFD